MVFWASVAAATYATTTRAVASNPWVPWGCIPTPAASLYTAGVPDPWKNVSNATYSTLTMNLYNQPLNVAKCIAACDEINHNKFVLDRGKYCICGRDLSQITTIGVLPMASCNIPCNGDDQKLCGGPTYPVLYATINGASSVTARYSAFSTSKSLYATPFPTYSCGPLPTTTTSGV